MSERKHGDGDGRMPSAGPCQDGGSFSVVEVISLIASFTLVVCYSYHAAIAVRTGYPVELVVPSTWDFVPALCNLLPFFVVLPILILRNIAAYRRCIEEADKHASHAPGRDGKGGRMWKLARGAKRLIGEHAVSYAFVQIAWTLELCVLTILGYCAVTATSAVDGPWPFLWLLVALVAIAVLVPFIKVPGRENSYAKALIQLTVEVLGTVGWVFVTPLAIAFALTLCSSTLLASLIVALVIAVILMGQWLFYAKGEEGLPVSAGEIVEEASHKVKSLNPLYCLFLMLFMSVVFGTLLSVTPGKAGMRLVKTEQDSDDKTVEQVYDVLDIYGGDRAVVQKVEEGRKNEGSAGSAKRYFVVPIDDGYSIEVDGRYAV